MNFVYHRGPDSDKQSNIVLNCLEKKYGNMFIIIP